MKKDGRFERIDRLYAFIATEDGGEGIMGMKFGLVWTPFIGADMERVKALKPYADLIAKARGISYEIRYFERKEIQ